MEVESTVKTTPPGMSTFDNPLAANTEPEKSNFTRKFTASQKGKTIVGTSERTNVGVKRKVSQVNLSPNPTVKFRDLDGNRAPALSRRGGGRRGRGRGRGRLTDVAAGRAHDRGSAESKQPIQASHNARQPAMGRRNTGVESAITNSKVQDDKTDGKLSSNKPGTTIAASSNSRNAKGNNHVIQSVSTSPKFANSQGSADQIPTKDGATLNNPNFTLAEAAVQSSQ